MRTKRARILGVTALVLAGVAGSSKADLLVDSLASDFSLAANSSSTTWSYGRIPSDYSQYGISSYLASNTRNANELWGTVFASPPTMWSDATGYWGVGRNDSGVTQSASGIVWAPGEILLHPAAANGADPLAMAFSWLAPSDMTVDIEFSWGQAMTPWGNGVRMRVGLNNTALTNPLGDSWVTEAGTHTISGVSVSAGDRLNFDYDVRGDASWDVTRTAITITQIPEPASGLVLLAGAAGLGLLRRRLHGSSRG